MRSGGNSFSNFPENKLTKLANLVQFKRMLMFCQEDWEGLGSTPLRHPQLIQLKAGCRKTQHNTITLFTQCYLWEIFMEKRPVAALHQGEPGQITYLEDPPAWLPPGSVIV